MSSSTYLIDHPILNFDAMRLKFISFILFLTINTTSAQNGVFNSINPNNTSTGMWSNGLMFQGWNTDVYFEVPTNNEPTPTLIYGGGIWLSGYDEEENLVISYQKYYDQNYIPGPYNEIALDSDSWNNVWKVTGEEIKAHIDDYELNCIVSATQKSIENWPGSGNEFLNLPIQDFAPFYDKNGNQIYEPHHGEFPAVKIDDTYLIPDEILYTVYHSTNGFEVHSILYGLDTELPLLEHTLFLQQTIYNRSESDLSDFSYGFWMDADIGCHKDDYAGSIPAMNSCFAYNSDEEDGEDDCTYSEPFYDDPPIMTFTLLNRTLDVLAMFYNHGWQHFPTGTTSPSSPEHHQQYLDGKWLNNEPFTNGGYGTTGDTIARHLFPGDPSNPNEWSMISAPYINEENNASMVAVTKKNSLDQDESLTIDAAIIYTNQPGHLSDYQYALENIEKVQEIYDDKFPTHKFVDKQPNLDNLITPNPAKDNIKLRSEINFDSYEIYNLAGLLIKQGVLKANSIKIDLPSGMYILRVKNEQESITRVARFIIS